MGVKLGLSHLREDHRPWMFQTAALRKMFGCNRDKVTGDWREIQNEELRDLQAATQENFSVYRVNEEEMGRRRRMYG